MTKKKRLELIKQIHQAMNYDWGLIEPNYEDLQDEMSCLRIDSREITEEESMFLDFAFEKGCG